MAQACRILRSDSRHFVSRLFCRKTIPNILLRVMQNSSSDHRAFLAASSRKTSFTYEYARPALTVDAALVSDEDSPQILLIKRGTPPFQHDWALPGGFVDEGESLDDAVYRELEEETSISLKNCKGGNFKLRQVHTFGDPGRDPRGWTVTVTFACIVNKDLKHETKAADDASEAAWFDINAIPANMAFDHRKMIREVCMALTCWDSTPTNVQEALSKIVIREDPMFTGGVKNPE